LSCVISGGTRDIVFVASFFLSKPRTMTVKWINSNEKEKLKDDIISGIVNDEMRCATVYHMHNGIYHKFEYTNFRTNLRNLRIAVAKLKAAAAEDAIAFNNVTLDWPVLVQVAPPQYPTWHNSVVKTLLLDDIKYGMTDGLKPAAVWHMRPEYSVYPIKVFHDHFNKEKTQPRSKLIGNIRNI
jgi:hypothetical protein